MRKLLLLLFLIPNLVMGESKKSYMAYECKAESAVGYLWNEVNQSWDGGKLPHNYTYILQYDDVYQRHTFTPTGKSITKDTYASGGLYQPFNNCKKTSDNDMIIYSCGTPGLEAKIHVTTKRFYILDEAGLMWSPNAPTTAAGLENLRKASPQMIIGNCTSFIKR